MAQVWLGSADQGPLDEDRDLVDRARAGDARAFEDLVRRHQQRVVRLARAFVPEPADAEDVAQEAFLRVYRGLARFRGASTFRTWLQQVVVNAARTHRRATLTRRARFGADADSASTDVPGPDRVEPALIARDRVERALNTLPQDLREAVVLRDVEGLDYREIAELLGVPMGTVESRIFRGRQRLRAAMTAVERGPVDPGEGGKRHER